MALLILERRMLSKPLYKCAQCNMGKLYIFLRKSFRYRVEVWCAERIFLMFQIKGINNFRRHFPTEFSLVSKKLKKNIMKKQFFVGFIPFDCLISSKIFCFNTLKIRLSFVKKPKAPSKTTFFDDSKTWFSGHSKNLGCDVFFVQNIHFSGYFCFFYQGIIQ